MEKRLPLTFTPIRLGNLLIEKYVDEIASFISLARLSLNTNGYGNLIAMIRNSACSERLFATGSRVIMEDTAADNITLISDIHAKKGMVTYYSANSEIVPTSEIIPWYMVLKEFKYFLKVIYHFHLPGERYILGEQLGILETEEFRCSGHKELGSEVIKTIKSYLSKCWSNKKPCNFPQIIAIKDHGYLILTDSLTDARTIYQQFLERLEEYQ